MYLRLGATAALTLMAATAAAQTTRVEAIAQEQATKARTLAPEGPNAAEQVVVRVMNSPLLSRGGGAYPWFGSVFGGSGFALGGGYLKRLPWDASANALVGISINNSKLLEARLQLPELWRGRLRVDAAARWTDAKDVSYFGVGAGSQLDDRDPYDYEPTELDTTVTLRPVPWAYASAGYTRLDIRAEDADGDTMAPLAAPGVGADLGYHVTRAGGGGGGGGRGPRAPPGGAGGGGGGGRCCLRGPRGLGPSGGRPPPPATPRAAACTGCRGTGMTNPRGSRLPSHPPSTKCASSCRWCASSSCWPCGASSPPRRRTRARACQ